MTVALVGYGRMGHEVEKVATERGHSIVCRVDPISHEAELTSVTEEALSNVDVVIEFALPDAVVSNARLYASTATPAVVGTTGWAKDLREVEALFETEGAYLWGSNFSIGAHIFSVLVEQAAALCKEMDAYDIFMYEIHHNKKKDSPSGTALSIAEGIIRSGKKRSIVTERLDRAPNPDELHVASVRGGSVPGIHTVMLDSEADTIELRHTARSRKGFALGAVLAAEWLAGKKGMFTIERFIAELLGVEEER